jgi:hypothetical protein
MASKSCLSSTGQVFYCYNCTVADNGSYGFYSANAGGERYDPNIIAKNSLFTGNNGYGIYKANGSSASMQNCLFYANTNGATYSIHSMYGSSYVSDLGNSKSGCDPKYVDPGALNYRLQAGSPALAAGMDLSGAPYYVTNDIVGASRPQGPWDMGAYESASAGEPARTNRVYVKTTGSDLTGNGSTTNPWATVSYALGQVAAGGTVSVAAGQYAERVQVGPGHALVTIEGGYDPVTWTWDPANQVTVIDGQGVSPLIVTDGANSNVFTSLTLKGGTGTSDAGIRFDVAAGGGSRFDVNGCTIFSNRYGVNARFNTLTLRNTLVARNTSYGMYFYVYNGAGTTGFVYNCTVANNGTNGMHCWCQGGDNRNATRPAVRNSLFTENNGYAMALNGNSSVGSYAYCLLYGNTIGTIYTEGATISDLGSNLTASAPGYSGIEPKYYRITQASPAYNTGTNLTAYGVTNDIDGTARPMEGVFDRGAYECQKTSARGTIMTVR